MIPWTKKYEPQFTKDIIGQELSLFKIKEAIKLKKPILIYGPTGTGKTSAAETIGKELKLELFEVNSSDQRNKESIQSILGNSISQQSLFSKGKLIIIDDIDALSGSKDRGGLPTIEGLLENCKYPVIITCINPWEDKFSKLRRKCLLVEFQPIKKDFMLTKLKKILDEEKITYQEKDLQEITKLSRGDLRAAINDLQTYSITKTIDDKSERDKNENILYCLRKILKCKKWDETINVFDKVDEDLDECLLWLDENLPKEYNSNDLKQAYNCLSKADVYKGRIRRWQHWRFLVYINLLVTSGVAFSKKETNIISVEYTRTTRLLKLWQANMRNAKKKSICEKIAITTHTSKKRALKDSFPYLKNILKDPRIIQELNLDEDEIEWIHK